MLLLHTLEHFWDWFHELLYLICLIPDTQCSIHHVLWLDENLTIAQQHIQTLNNLATEFNRAFYAGIHEVEAHFACYNAGEFYALHRDNPQGKNGRVISAVYYLHEEWHDDWGGELRLQDKNDQWHIIANMYRYLNQDLSQAYNALKTNYTDVSNLTFEARQSIAILELFGVVDGNGKFDPNEHLTRGQFAELLYKSLTAIDFL